MSKNFEVNGEGKLLPVSLYHFQIYNSLIFCECRPSVDCSFTYQPIRRYYSIL